MAKLRRPSGRSITEDKSRETADSLPDREPGVKTRLRRTKGIGRPAPRYTRR